MAWKRHAAALVATALGLAALSSCSGKATQAGGLEVIVTTLGLQAPSDFDTMEVVVEQESSPGGKWNTLVDVSRRVPSEVPLPTTVSIQAGSGPDQDARIFVTASKNGNALVERGAQLQVPTNRVAELLIVLSELCAGKVTTCANGSCEPYSGACGSIVIEDPSTLPNYTPGDEDRLDAGIAPLDSSAGAPANDATDEVEDAGSSDSTAPSPEPEASLEAEASLGPEASLEADASSNSMPESGSQSALPCDINGTSHAKDTPNPSNACQTCQPGLSTSAWSNVADGTGCGSGNVCGGGTCVAACTPGTTRNAMACGNCGTTAQSCSTNGLWQDGTCTGQGACAPNASAACNTYGTWTCSAACAWGSCSCAAAPVCSPGTTCQSSCNTLTCNGCGQWPGTCGGTCSLTFSYTGAPQTFVVPPSVTQVTITAAGAAGGTGSSCLGSSGYVPGEGASVTATIPVTAGETLTIEVGGVGGNAAGASSTTTAVPGAAGGFNGGGAGGGIAQGGEGDYGAGGGGSSDVRRGGAALANRVVVAAGGGGAGGFSGGAGGTTTGMDGASAPSSAPTLGTGGGGGTQSSGGAGAPGATSGALGSGGVGTSGSICGSGGGGSGYYGGGGGGCSGGAGNTYCIGGGGGGSSFAEATATNVTMMQGVQAGNGQVLISY